MPLQVVLFASSLEIDGVACTGPFAWCPHDFFFPRVRTPCGHGAQVIVEGRKSQLDGGENNKTTTTTQKTTNKGPQAESPHHVVFPLCWMKPVRQERVSGRGPELTNEEHFGAGLCLSKVAMYKRPAATLQCGKIMVTMQVTTPIRCIAMLQHRLHP